MSFRLEEIDGIPRAVFEDEDPLRRRLLPHFLLPEPYFVPDMLYELSLVERGAFGGIESSGFETPHVIVEFFRDRVVVEACCTDENAEEEDIERIELTPHEAQLFLLEWGVALQRRVPERKTRGNNKCEK